MGRGRSKVGGGRLAGSLRAFRQANGGESIQQAATGQFGSEITVSPFQTVGDYTDNNNPQLVKFQGQTDDKTANFLAKVDRDTDLSAIQANTNDKWAFYDNPQQKLVEQLGLNGAPTIMSEKDFNAYVQQTGATVLYRGWSGQNAIDRFKQSPNSHIGNGINGDGYYWAADISTARNYAGSPGAITKGALSPTARVVSLDAVNTQISNSSPKLRSSLRYAGSGGTRTYGVNEGQAQMALKMGYNVIDAGWAVIPLTRDATVVSNRNTR